jgi:hypothetical protein
MKLERNLALVAVAACAMPLLLWLWTFWSPTFATEHVKWSEFGSFIGGVLSPLLAFVSFLGLLATINQQRAAATRQKIESDDLNYFNHAAASLERAYETLTANRSATEPVRDRLAWLSCARLLLSASNVSKRISPVSVGLLALYEGEEEHWRRRFYELFHPEGALSIGVQSTYFSHPTSADGVQIEERSIRVIYEFFTWPEGKEDPIDSVPKYTIEELESMSASMSGVREYVRTMPRFRSSSNA